MFIDKQSILRCWLGSQDAFALQHHGQEKSGIDVSRVMTLDESSEHPFGIITPKCLGGRGGGQFKSGAPRGKYRLGVISNFDKRLRTIFGRLDLTRFFEKIIISSEAGVDKPDPRIFEQALFAMNLQPAMAIHVGDDPVRDWHAAAAAGMHVFRLNPPENSLADLVDFLNDRASG